MISVSLDVRIVSVFVFTAIGVRALCNVFRATNKVTAPPPPSKSEGARPPMTTAPN